MLVLIGISLGVCDHSL